MAPQAHPANPLALAVLALLYERPMHPYEMGVILKQRHKEESIKLRYGSLYTVIAFLLQRGLIAARETEREGRRPERTVYEITPAGAAELHDWMAHLIGQPIKEYPQFEAALCLLPVLPPDEARHRVGQFRSWWISGRLGAVRAGWSESSARTPGRGDGRPDQSGEGQRRRFPPGVGPVRGPGHPHLPGDAGRLAADAAGADNGLAPAPAVAGVVDQLCRLPDDRHLLDPAPRLGRGPAAAHAGTGNVQVFGRVGVMSARSLRPVPPSGGDPHERIRAGQPLPCVAATGTAARDAGQGYARAQDDQGEGGHDGNEQTRAVHDSGAPLMTGGVRRVAPRGRLFADFGVAALRIHHDPPGFAAVQLLVASPVGQRVTENPGEKERQRRPGKHEHPEHPGDRVERECRW